jgi:hypothetical protein
MSVRACACEECGEAVDPAADGVVLALEKTWVAGGEPPEVRVFVDGRECYFHEHHLPPDAEYVYRIVGNATGAGTRSSRP